MKQSVQSLAAIVLALGGAMGVPAALAAPSAADGDLYLYERSMCDRIQQDRAACIREAGAAREAARRGNLTHPADNYAQNALARCQLQPPADRMDCEARVRGTGMTSIEGSVLGGGVIRETVTPVVAQPVMPAMPMMPMAPMAPVVPVMPAMPPVN